MLLLGSTMNNKCTPPPQLPSFQAIFGPITLEDPSVRTPIHSLKPPRTIRWRTASEKPHREKKRVSTVAAATGRWSAKEQNLFVQGLSKYGRDWKKIGTLIPSRTLVQIRTHAQKMFQKLNIKASDQITQEQLRKLVYPSSLSRVLEIN